MRSVFTLLTLILLSIGGYSQTLSNKLEEIGKRNHLTGMSVCVIKSGKPICKVNEGFRDIARNLPVNDSTVFRIASISKMFTVTALMQLYDQGRFKLTDDVSSYLGFKLQNPNFPNVPITFTMLMSHTGSLRDGKGYDDFLSASYQGNSIPELRSVLCRDGTRYTEDIWSNSDAPGTGVFSYANINFGILGTLVECISHQRFDTYCIEHIFKTLQIGASFDVRDISNISNVAVIYRNQDSTWTPQNDNYKGVV